MTKAKRHLRAIPTSASPEEAAAIVAALEHFMRATAPPASAPPANSPDDWRRAALLEGISRGPEHEDVSWMFPTPG